MIKSFELLVLTIVIFLGEISTILANTNGTSAGFPTNRPGGASNLTRLGCYRCNNGFKRTPYCVHEIKKVDASQNIGSSSWNKNSRMDNCKTIGEFFSQFNDATDDWIKRSMFTEKKGGRRRRRGASDDVTAYCVSIVTYVAGIETPQILRDCIEGVPKVLRKNFRNQMDFQKSDFQTLPGPNDTKMCWNKKNSANKGTEKVTVCLCQMEMCNKEDAGELSSDASEVMLMVTKFFPVITILSVLLTTL